ncbi:helix-turn-helix domain-containing protein [Nocardia sp. NPDC051787]|uniref:helix-turn-helix domain-containing protein n=1 Tax=Nocardia sp. NPDC051787 TaxID=3155415 RepID=UPI003426D838
MEERKIRKIAGARHAPGDWIRRARMITASWDGKSTAVIADELGCHPQTVRERLHRFNTHGLEGLGDVGCRRSAVDPLGQRCDVHLAVGQRGRDGPSEAPSTPATLSRRNLL